MTEQLTEAAPAPASSAPAAPAGPTRVDWAPVPKVNLLPGEILEARRFRRVQVVLATALAGTVAVAVLGTLWAGSAVNDARDELTNAQNAVTALQAQQAKYADVPKVTGQVESARKARSLALGNDVLWYRFLNDLEGVTPSGVLLPDLTVALNSTSTAGAGGNPLAPAGIGQFSASGSAGTYQQIAALMDGLDKVNGLRSTALTSATQQSAQTGVADSVDVTVSAVLSSDALSGRYDPKAE